MSTFSAVLITLALLVVGVGLFLYFVVRPVISQVAQDGPDQTDSFVADSDQGED